MNVELTYRIRPFSRLAYNTDWEWALDHSRRQYLVRPSIDSDHPMIASDREEAITKGYKCWCESITVIRLRDGRRWIFSNHTINFPDGFEDTDAHARARIEFAERQARKRRPQQ